MYRLIALIYPKKIRETFYRLFSYATFPTDNAKFLGFITSSIALVALGIGFFIGFAYEINFILVSIATFIILLVTFYFWLLLNADKKAKYIEEILPDALFLMASNLRAGFTVDKAILLSARDEFGPLKDELLLVSKEITTGKPIEAALLDLIRRIKSEKLEKSLSLIITGLKSGGRLASLLQETANDLKNQSLIDKKIRSSVNMYIIFIFIATGVGAPMLFGLSSFLVQVLTSVLKSVEIPTAATGAMAMPISIKPGNISENFVILYSMINILFSSIFGAFIIGLIKKGSEKEGITTIPLLIALSIAIFFLVRILAKFTIGGLFTF